MWKYQITGYVTSYSNYNALGQAGTITYANGVSTVYQYRSDNNRLYSITTNSPTEGELQDLLYGYDNVGNITAITDNIDSTRSQGFVYDDINRLTEAQRTSYETLTYSYNPIGNMTYNSQVGNYTYPTNRIRPHAVTQAGTNTYIYDANGNMTSGAGRTIAYNYDNMPTSITRNGTTVSSVYDYSGQRVKKTVSSVTSVYIGKLYECTSSVCTKYIFAGSQRIATKKQGVVYYYHTDHLGSSSIITDSAGNKAEEIYYYPFGGTRFNQGSVNVKHKFTGQEEDAETGLYYYGARYYDPILARFISADTIVPLPFHPQTLNRYAYAYNNPIVLQDLNGHEPGYYWSTWDWLYGYNNSQPNNCVEINTTQYNTSDSSSLWNFSWNQSTVETYQVTPSNAVGNGGNNSVSGNSSIFNSQVNNSSSILYQNNNSYRDSDNLFYDSSGYGDLGYVKYTAFTNSEDMGLVIKGPYSIEKKLYTGYTFGNQNSLLGVTTYPDSSPSYSIGDFGINSTGVSLPFGSNTSIGFSIKGPSISVRTTFDSSSNPSMISRDVTTYSLTPFVDNLRDSLSTSYKPNPYIFVPPPYMYALP